MLLLEAPPALLIGVPATRHHRRMTSAAAPSIRQELPDAAPEQFASDHLSYAAPLLDNSQKHPQRGVWRVFLLDAKPLCYDGSRPCFRSFARWISLLFAQVSLRNPVVAVFDGDDANGYRRRILPSYKALRRPFVKRSSLSAERGSSSLMEIRASNLLQKCNVPVMKVPGYEADDVVASLADHVLQRGFQVVICSPDKDFKQLLSKDVKIVMPVPELGRWSFYTLNHYIAQYKCDPNTDLSLRCFLGDETDGVPGIQHLVPGFGRRTAMKLLKKHGSLENLLCASAVRTVGKDYVQDALAKYADHLRRNYSVLSLRRDANIYLEEEWLKQRDTFNDDALLSCFIGDQQQLQS